MIRLVIFDLDGTLFKSHLNWNEIRNRLDIPQGRNILKELWGRPECQEKMDLLQRIERENTLKTSLRPHVKEFFTFLRRNAIKTALITNNSRTNTEYLLQKFNLSFDLVLTREATLWKPDPDPMLHVISHFNVLPRETASIGDTHYDTKASKSADIRDIFIIDNDVSKLIPTDPSITIFRNFRELKAIFNKRYMSTRRHQ